MTEPGTGSDLQSIKTRAMRDGDDYVINGAKTFITNGLLADLVVVVAQDRPRRTAAKGISLIVVETDDLAGFRAAGCSKKIGQHGQDTAELFFDDVRVPVDQPARRRRGAGLRPADAAAAAGAAIIAVGRGAGDRGGARADVDYTKDRKAFGKPVFNFQNTRFKLAEAATEATIARVVPRRLHRKHLAASSTCRPPRWPSGGRRRRSATSSTSACSSSAATAT